MNRRQCVLALISNVLASLAASWVMPTTRRASHHQRALRLSLTEPPPLSILNQPGTAILDKPWAELGFEYRPTKSHLKMVWKNGTWGTPELVQGDPYIRLHIGATALHYGQACLEGLKAFCHPDNKVYIFRPDEHAMRMQSSCQRIHMPELPTDLFVRAMQSLVQDNLAYVPPYGSNGALYIRPLLFGTGPRIGVQPADEYTFLSLAIPAGDYYRGGLSQPVDALLIENYDRAAPRGLGHVKVAGNYAADLLPNVQSKQAGFPIGLYLDARTQSTIEEFSTSNFVGIRGNTYVTPSSPSVLPSVTNKCLMYLAENELGMTVEQREIPVEELAEFSEVLAVGTAVVVTPVGSITQLHSPTPKGCDSLRRYQFGELGQVGPVTMKLYQMIRRIQNGEEEDKCGWNVRAT